MKPIDHKELWIGSDVLAGKDDRSQLLSELSRILDYLPQMIWASLPGDPPIEHYNRHWVAFTGVAMSPDGQTRRKLIHPDDRDQALALWHRARETGEPYQAQYRLLHHSGEYRWIMSRGEPQRDANGKVVCWYGTCTDIHDSVRSREALNASEALNRGIIQSSADCIKLIDAAGTIVFMNDAAIREHSLIGPDGAVGASWLDTVPAESRDHAARALKDALRGVTARFTTARFLDDGEAHWRDFALSPVIGKGGSIEQVVVSSRDVTDERQIHEKLKWASNHDGLTKLPNRTFFDECVQEAIRQVGGTSLRVGLLMVDVDHLKQINDALGHDAGDCLLTVFAERLQECVGPHDVVGRLGGDEFGVLLTDVSSPQDVVQTAERILERLREPFHYEGRLLDCRASIGGSIFPEQGKHKAELMKCADLALYSAKRAGRLQAVMFEPSMRAEMQTRSSMLSLTRDAMREGRLFPCYQPKIELATGAVVGFEALLRWQDASGRIHLPGTIAAAFQDKELAPAITHFVIDAAVEDIVGWRDAGLPFGHVAINASAPDFRAADFADRLLERLEKRRIPPECVQIEVTETVFLGRGAECVETALSTLSKAGIKIALDDFGTGYASLSHLKRFPVDILKIDQSFIRDLDSDPEDAAIVEGIINLATSLGMEVVAEGIESESQAAFLIGNGCRLGQGYLFERAVNAARVPEVIDRTDRPVFPKWTAGVPGAARSGRRR